MFDKIKSWLKRRSDPGRLVSTAPRRRAHGPEVPVPKSRQVDEPKVRGQGINLFNPVTGLSHKMITAHGPESAMLDDHLTSLKLERKAYELDLFTDRSL